MASLLDEKQLLEKNFGLTEAEFHRLLADLRQGDDTLFRQVFIEHFESCMQYLKRQMSAAHADAYDATMDTLLLFCGHLKAGKVSYGNIRFLFTRMARQHYVRMQKKAQAHIALEEQFDLPSSDESSAIPDDVLDALDRAWDLLEPDCRQLLKSFYYDRVKLIDLATQLGKTDSNMRKQKERCLRKLQTLFQQIYSS